jgi:hypothetical protein
VSKRDIGASVRQRLLNQAHEQGRPFQELLQYFVMERFLYRLSKSQFRDSFIPFGSAAVWKTVAKKRGVAVPLDYVPPLLDPAFKKTAYNG